MTASAERIEQALADLEREQSIRILYACESGSRAWGFASQDSDYDIRFIYARPAEWYLSLDRGADNIVKPIVDDLDLSGWDLDKTLRLFRKSNPPLIEWFQSPIVYRDSDFAESMRSMTQTYFSPRSCISHYLHMAEGNLKKYLAGNEVPTKKYFYVLRPMLACRWIEATGTMPPTEFEPLLRATLSDPGLLAEIDSLLRVKRAGVELGTGPRNTKLSEFLIAEISRLVDVVKATPKTEPPAYTELNQMFLSGIGYSVAQEMEQTR